MNLDRKILQKFIEVASQNLCGEWLLVGGTVLPLLGARHRSTVDIDFVGLGKNERAQQLEVFKVAEKLGLPVDSINGAASLFVDRLLKSKSELVPIIKNKKCTIYRPDTILYFKLKISRLSESDLSDCLEWLDFLAKSIERKTKTSLKKLIEIESKKSANTAGKNSRLEILHDAL